MLALKRTSSLSIKTVGPFDLGRLARLHQSCFDEPWSRADLAHLLALPGGFGLLARLFERHLAGLDRRFAVGVRIARGLEQLVALAQRDVERVGERQQRVAARARAAGLDEAQVPGRDAGFGGQPELARAAQAAPAPELVPERARAGAAPVGHRLGSSAGAPPLWHRPGHPSARSGSNGTGYGCAAASGWRIRSNRGCRTSMRRSND